MSPVLSSISPFGVLLALGLVLGILVSERLARSAGLSRAIGAEALVSAGAWSLIAARAFYVLGSPARESLLDTLALSLGGLSGYGALIGGAVGGTRVLSRCGAPVWTYLDVAAPGALLAIGIARLGCLLYGCDFGAPRPSGFGSYPTQLWEATFALLLSMSALVARRFQTRNGQVFVASAFAYAVLRFVLEPLRGDADRGVFRVLTLTQWCALASSAMTLGLFVVSAWRARPDSARFLGPES